MYRVCLALAGCFQSDSVSAVEQSILDGVDVINFSISGGQDPYSDPVELAFLDAFAAGISVNASAGNSGPGAGTANHASPWVTTVGASTSPRQYSTTLRVRADNGEVFTASGGSLTHGISRPTPLIDAADVPGYNDSLCKTPLPAGSVEGMVVACERGVVGRVEKGYYVLQGGGAGMVLWNASVNQDVDTDNHWLPAVHLGGESDGIDFNAFIDSHTGERAVWERGTANPQQPDVMTSFSSRGPVGDFMKPDVTGPGIQILAGHTPEPLSTDFFIGTGGPPGEFFQAIAGTSMSSPHSAGVSALVKASHPAWSPAAIKSAIVTTAAENVFKEDGVTPADAFDMGGGSVRADPAVGAALVLQAPALDFFLGERNPIDLNTPTINAPTMPGVLTTTRTVTNVSGANLMVTTATETSDGPGGAEITVRPESFLVPAGGSRTFTVILSALDAPNGEYFGTIRMGSRPASGGAPILQHIPVAFNKTVPVAVTHTCDPTTIPVGSRSDCEVVIANNASEVVGVDAKLVPTDPSVIQVDDVSPPAEQVGNNSWEFRGLLSAAVAPTIDDIAPGGAGLGYLSLASLGVPAFLMSDEEIVNFSTDPYLFGSEEYTQVGMVSDGYAVVGGGTVDDVQFIAQDIPDPAAPNNVLAPFWSDLNPGVGGRLYAADLTDDETGQTWVVLEWEEVPQFEEHSQIYTFQVWIETTPGTEMHSFEYDLVGGSGAGNLVVGAENRDGTSAAQLNAVPAVGESYHVETSPPVPGGLVTITYDAVGTGEGTQKLRVRVIDGPQGGVTVVSETIRVT
jgi:hypothetical protein